MHRDAGRSAGLHLFQELSTLGQQLAHTLLFRQGLGGVKPMFPASTSRPGQPFGGSRSCTAPCSSFGFVPHRSADSVAEIKELLGFVS